MSAVTSQITSLTIVYSTVYSDADQRKHQSSASLAFVWGIHRRPVNSPHKWPVTRKMFPFDDVIMQYSGLSTRRDKVIILCLVQIDENIFAWDVIKFAFWYPNVHVQLWFSSQCCRIKNTWPVIILNTIHSMPETQKNTIETPNFKLNGKLCLGYEICLQHLEETSNGSWCMGIKGEISGTVCVTFTWYMYIYELFIAFVCFVVCSLL